MTSIPMSDDNGHEAGLDGQRHWLFDPDYYRRQFERHYGRAFNPREDGSLYSHFLEVGQFIPLSGHVLFDPLVYQTLTSYDIACRIKEDGPFSTFLQHSKLRGLLPVSSNLFDPLWYLQRYPKLSEDISQGLWDCPLHHYIKNDEPTEFDPSPHFSERGYLDEHNDVALAVKDGQLRNGYAHFLAYGRAEGRRYFPAGATSLPGEVPGISARRDYPLRSRTFSEVTLLPCQRDGSGKYGYSFGVLDRAGAAIKAFAHPWIVMRSAVEGLPMDTRTFIYGGVLMDHFGHVLRDSLASLWFLREQPDLPILWHWIDLPVPHRAWPGWLNQLWQVIGLDKRQHVLVSKPLSVAELILPQSGLVAPNLLHERQAEALAVQPAPNEGVFGERVWLSRRGLPDQFGRLVGEESLEAVLLERDWQIIRPETLPVAKQIELFAKAEIIAGFMSSAFHAALLSKAPRAKLLLVVRPGIDKSFYDAAARARGLQQDYIIPMLQPYERATAWTTYALSDPKALADEVCERAAMAL